MTQREFFDWFHGDFCGQVVEFCHARPDDGAFKYVDILLQARTLLDYESACCHRMNYEGIMNSLKGWMNDKFEPNLLEWVDNDLAEFRRKIHGDE